MKRSISCVQAILGNLEAIDDITASTLVVILRDVAEDLFLGQLAEALLKQPRELIAAWGTSSKRFHDITDRIAISRYGFGPITIWESSEGLPDFIWQMLFPLSGLDPKQLSDGMCIINVSTGPDSLEDINAMLAEWI